MGEERNGSVRIVRAGEREEWTEITYRTVSTTTVVYMTFL
jgi:hypothetical protein